MGTYNVLCLCLVYSAVLSLPPPTLDDLLNIVRITKSTKSYEFGLELGIDKSDLDIAWENYRNDCVGQLSEVLNLYLRQPEDPSWMDVAIALCTIGEVQSAKAIMNEYVVCIDVH